MRFLAGLQEAVVGSGGPAELGRVALAVVIPERYREHVPQAEYLLVAAHRVLVERVREVVRKAVDQETDLEIDHSSGVTVGHVERVGTAGRGERGRVRHLDAIPI